MFIVFRNLNPENVFFAISKGKRVVLLKKMHFLTQREDFFAPNQNLQESQQKNDADTKDICAYLKQKK